MIVRPRTRSFSSQSGFTLIELLVVILIIGILAAIAIPSFLGQRERAQDAEAKSAARTAQVAAATYFVAEQSYTGISRATLTELEPTLADAPWSSSWCNSRTGAYGDRDTLCVAMQSRGSRGLQFEIRRDDTYGPGFVRVCSIPGTSGCKSTGRW